MEFYFKGLKLGASLPDTELQPVDDLALLTAQTYVNLWTITDDTAYLCKAVVVLEFGLTKSKQSYLMRILLIRLYQLLGTAARILSYDIQADCVVCRRTLTGPGTVPLTEHQADPDRHFVPSNLVAMLDVRARVVRRSDIF